MTTRKAPWQKPDPRPDRACTPLTDDEKRLARERAERAGRRYPNLVDNLWVLADRRRTARSGQH